MLCSSLDTYTLANRRAGVGLIWAVFSRQLTAGLQRGVVDRFKDLYVEQLSFVTLERETHQDKSIGQPLHSDTNGPVEFVRFLRLSKKVKRHSNVNE